jgi:hypothetical protein
MLKRSPGSDARLSCPEVTGLPISFPALVLYSSLSSRRSQRRVAHPAIVPGGGRRFSRQMVKDGQVKNLRRGAYVRPDYQETPDNADNLTNGRSNVRTSGVSGHPSGRDGMPEGPEPDGSSPSEEKALLDD